MMIMMMFIVILIKMMMMVMMMMMMVPPRRKEGSALPLTFSGCDSHRLQHCRPLLGLCQMYPHCTVWSTKCLYNNSVCTMYFFPSQMYSVLLRSLSLFFAKCAKCVSAAGLVYQASPCPSPHADPAPSGLMESELLHCRIYRASPLTLLCISVLFCLLNTVIIQPSTIDAM